MTVSGNVVSRGTKTATKVSDRGLFVGTATNNAIADSGNDFDLCTTPVADTGNVSSWRMRAKRFGAFGAKPAIRPGVSGSVADGSAQKSLIAALTTLGWIDNQTTN